MSPSDKTAAVPAAPSCSEAATQASSNPGHEPEQIQELATVEFSAALSMAQVERGLAASQDSQRTRRALLATLTKSKAELCQAFGSAEQAPDFLLDLVEAGQEHIERAQRELELLRSAQARLMAVAVTLVSAQEGGAA